MFNDAEMAISNTIGIIKRESSIYRVFFYWYHMSKCPNFYGFYLFSKSFCRIIILYLCVSLESKFWRRKGVLYVKGDSPIWFDFLEFWGNFSDFSHKSRPKFVKNAVIILETTELVKINIFRLLSLNLGYFMVISLNSRKKKGWK